ncbi:MAG: gfo/Idh/MocA family oxidoreductase [Chloroflexi bacterium CFX4]|nr:gfo/Idh/MocA family oxidoreductase [Chloroflexi bacterium CFX4]MDL1922971.1 Gfo/Idh/MocA family oxidoreductase [Chloroflexi bacterium CFX3]
MTTSLLRAGIVGLGIGGEHARGFVRSPHTELVALCDSDPNRLAQRAAEYGVPPELCFTDYKTMLAEAKLDVVSICLPNALHAESTIAALEGGAHVICEKPLAPSLFEARDMQRAAEINHRRLMVAYNHRYRADVLWIRRMIAEGRLGKIYNAYAWWRRETGIPGSGWFSQKHMAGGGALIDLGVHMLDMTLWLLGFPRVQTVSGHVTSYFGGRGLKVWGSPRWVNDASAEAFSVDDGAVGFLRCEGDLAINLHASWAEHRQPREDIIRLELSGTEGTAVLNVVNYVRDGTLHFYSEMAGEAVTVTPSLRWNGIYGHEALIVESMAALVNNQPAPADVTHGVIGVQVLEALYASSQSKREVVLS